LSEELHGGCEILLAVCSGDPEPSATTAVAMFAEIRKNKWLLICDHHSG